MVEVFGGREQVALLDREAMRPKNTPDLDDSFLDRVKSTRMDNRLKELDGKAQELKDIPLLSEEEKSALLKEVQDERNIILAGLEGKLSGSETDAVGELGEFVQAMLELVKEALLPEPYEIPLSLLPVAQEGVAANRLRKIAEVIMKFDKVADKFLSHGLAEESIQVVRKTFEETLKTGNTDKLGAIIDALKVSKNPKKQIVAEELERLKVEIEAIKTEADVVKVEARSITKQPTAGGYGVDGYKHELHKLHAGNVDKGIGVVKDTGIVKNQGGEVMELKPTHFFSLNSQ